MRLLLCAELAAAGCGCYCGWSSRRGRRMRVSAPALDMHPEAEPALDVHPEASLLQRPHRRTQSPARIRPPFSRPPRLEAKQWLRACRMKAEAAAAVRRPHRRCWCSCRRRTSLVNSSSIFSFQPAGGRRGRAGRHWWTPLSQSLPPSWARNLLEPHRRLGRRCWRCRTAAEERRSGSHHRAAGLAVPAALLSKVVAGTCFAPHHRREKTTPIYGPAQRCRGYAVYGSSMGRFGGS